MHSRYQRAWGGIEWQEYAFRLVQIRHGATNVQRVPDRVRGDGGLEFFTTDGCLIQCYAPEETSDTAKAASRMKAKATRDLLKLISNRNVIDSMLGGIKASRWFLLCPFLDDKSVITHVRKKASEVAAKGLPFLDADFQGLVHCQEDFASQIDLLRAQAVGPPISVHLPDQADVDRTATSAASETLLRKLSHAFPGASAEELERRKMEFVKSLIHHENTLNALKNDHPTVWEQAYRTIASEEKHLLLVGASGNAPREQLVRSLDRITEGLKHDLPTLSHSMKQDLSQGALSDWLMRCPLDFH
ncbi:hypothetical protein [Methylobacterium sp. SD21]|uniref:hypothetical protein n=1 Tax=Methylobacterium litchii TaxID=3138810 RepID=UPI00313DA341